MSNPLHPNPVAIRAARPGIRNFGLVPALALALFVGNAVADDVSIQTVGAARVVQTPKYEATVADDGCLTNLRLGGREFLNPKICISRGSYFFQNGPLKLPAVEQAGNVITAKGEQAAIRYEFGADSMTWSLENLADKPMVFYIVFDHAVSVMMDDKGVLAKTPVKQAAGKTVWFRENSRLEIKGGLTVWPWTENSQVWQVSLAPKEKRQVTLKIGDTSPAEAAKIATLATASAAPAPVVASKPVSVTAAGVTIETANGGRVVKTPKYEASVADDGCLTSLRVGGREFLNAKVRISRGSYFFYGGPVKLPVIEQVGNSITAKGEKAAIRYEFGADTMGWSLESLADKPMPFYIVFDFAVSAFMNEQGEFAKMPVSQNAAKTVWFRENSRLEIEGGLKVWPWEQNSQVWEVILAPGEKRQITFKIGSATSAEAAKVSALTMPAPVVEKELTVLSPRNYQVFQRSSRLSGSVVVSGRVAVDCDAVEARIVGKPLEGVLPAAWQRLPLVAATRSFHAELPLAAGGWYQLEVRALKAGKVVATTTVDKFGVGEVFVGAGQSNSTNYGQEKTKQTSGMVSAFSGSEWQLADDPQPGPHDRSGGGSFWPAFGDAMFERYHVPIGIATTGHGGTSVKQWRPGEELHNWMMTRIHQLGVGGFRAVLWHQGESDVGLTSDEYALRLTEVIRGSTAAAGWQFPWFVAQVSYHNPEKPSYATTRSAQKQLWDTGVALAGPDTDTLTGDNRDNNGKGIHFSLKGLSAHGKMWAEQVGGYLDKALGKH